MAFSPNWEHALGGCLRLPASPRPFAPAIAVLTQKDPSRSRSPNLLQAPAEGRLRVPLHRFLMFPLKTRVFPLKKKQISLSISRDSLVTGALPHSANCGWTVPADNG